MKREDKLGKNKIEAGGATLLVAGMLMGSLATPLTFAPKAEAWAADGEIGVGCICCEKEREESTVRQNPQMSHKLSTQDERLIRALQFEDWRFLKLPDFREKVFQAADTSEYRELWDRLTGEDSQMKEALSPDLASFVYDVLLPLTSESWLDQTFSGEVQIVPQDSQNTTRIEYTFQVKLLRPEVIRVGDYQDSVAQVPQMFSDLFLGNTTYELRDVKAIREKIETFLDDWLPYAQTPEMTISDVGFAYFPPEEKSATRNR